METGIDGEDRDFGPTVLVRDAVERFEERPRSRGNHARVDGSVRDVDNKDVDRRLGRSNLPISSAVVSPSSETHHVLCRRDKLDDTAVELRARPTVGRLVLDLVPVKELRHLVR